MSHLSATNAAQRAVCQILGQPDRQQGDQMEAAVTAARIAASDGEGAVFAPLAMDGVGDLRAGGLPAERLARWLNGMESGCLFQIIPRRTGCLHLVLRGFLTCFGLGLCRVLRPFFTHGFA
jgi:hypothetical protein